MRRVDARRVHRPDRVPRDVAVRQEAHPRRGGHGGGRGAAGLLGRRRGHRHHRRHGDGGRARRARVRLRAVGRAAGREGRQDARRAVPRAARRVHLGTRPDRRDGRARTSRETPYVYLCYVAATPYPHHVVSRVRAAGDVAEAGSEEVLFEGDDQTKLGGHKIDGHQGGAIHFGLDGKLYVAIGEQTAETPAQSLESLLGKILRLNPDGTIPEDNPFASEAEGKYRAIWAMGCRNPFAFAVQPETGRIFLNDVGGGAEEINEGMAGANYGWPTVDHGPTADPRFRGPIHHYPTACITGGAFSSERSPWPAEYRGKYFFADFNHGFLKVVDPDSPAVARGFATGLRRPVDIRFAPNGDLYVLLRDAWVIDDVFRSGTGLLLRIRLRVVVGRVSRHS